MKKNIYALVVDDEPTNRLVLSRSLERFGITAMCAEEGEEALVLFANHSFDIVFLDIQMPHLSGFQVVEKMRVINPDVPVVAWTCSIDRSQVNFQQAGFAAFMDKPLDRMEFIYFLKKFLQIDSSIIKESGILDDSQLVRDELEEVSGQIMSCAINFRSQLPARIGELSQAVDQRLWDDLLFLSFKLKGTSKLLGCNHLVAMLRKLEIAANHENSRAAMTVMAALLEAIELPQTSCC